MHPMTCPCPHCGQGFTLTPEYLDRYGGKVTECPACSQQFSLPSFSDVFGADRSLNGSETSDCDVGVVPEPAGEPAVPELASGIWREGYKAVVVRGAMLPRQCFRCNAPVPSDVPIDFLLRYTRGGSAGIVAHRLRGEDMLVRAYACARHRSRVNGARAAALALFALAGLSFVAGMFVLMNTRNPTAGLLMIVAAGPLTIVGKMVVLVMPWGLVPRRIDRVAAWAGGFGWAFLSQFPTVTQARAAQHARVVENLENPTG